jgi:hypothetical protein
MHGAQDVVSLLIGPKLKANLKLDKLNTIC